MLSVCFSGHVTSEGIIDDRNRVWTRSVGGKSEVRAVLVYKVLRSKVYKSRLQLRKVAS